jgi:Zn-dependent peptidase ImmA (M78 family)/DNA-binding XRE family transcriptional regulator
VLPGSRLTTARLRRGLTKSDLARLVGVTSQAIGKFEADKTSPSEDVAKKLFETLRFGARFFEASPVEVVQPDMLSFRTLSQTKAASRRAACGSATIISEIIAPAIDAVCELAPLEVPDLSGEEPEVAAAIVREEWGLAYRPIPNVLRLLESKGVRVYSVSDDLSVVDAFSFWCRGTPFVVMHTTKATTGERPRFDGAHELAHLVLHRREKPVGREVEQEADRFASAFLMPRDAVLAEAPQVVTLGTVRHLKKRWGVSYAAYVRRLSDLGLISAQKYRMLCIDMSRRGYRKQEPDGIGRESAITFKKLFAALEGRGVTLEAFAKRIALDPQELSSLMFNCAPRVVVTERPQMPTKPTGRLRLVEA